eukprot:TRINITY_DN3584_c0_g1_i7.p1 TRINITY_DN3584_c0_g1~~TRINITY_DN3584_c0_g1_i7.p1  ORF type:complete len:343 (-),score=58.65 TRINITY_DN3584_c0_g1_i7:445-1473(-)
MTPNTMSRFTRDVGVAYQYVELPPPPSLFRKSYMHTQICDRPFNVTVVNIAALRAAAAAAPRLEEPTPGSISRAPSFDDLVSDSPPPDPTGADTASSAAAVSSSSAAASGAVSETPSRGGGGTRRRRRSSPGEDPSVSSPCVVKSPTMSEGGDDGELEEDDATFAANLNNDRHGSLPRTAPYRAGALASDPAELACSVRARLSSPRLGFDPKECHDGIALLDRQHCAQRVQDRGLYKTVRAVLPVVPPNQTHACTLSFTSCGKLLVVVCASGCRRGSCPSRASVARGPIRWGSPRRAISSARWTARSLGATLTRNSRRAVPLDCSCPWTAGRTRRAGAAVQR